MIDKKIYYVYDSHTGGGALFYDEYQGVNIWCADCQDADVFIGTTTEKSESEYKKLYQKWIEEDDIHF